MPVAIVRRGTKTNYELLLPKSALPGLPLTAGAILGFDYIANDNDGAGYRGAVEWTPGMTGTKDSSLSGNCCYRVRDAPGRDRGFAHSAPRCHCRFAHSAPRWRRRRRRGRVSVDRRFLGEGGVAGILALGTTGEGILLSADERRRVAEGFVGSARGRLAVAVHAGAQTTAETVALSAHAAAIGADAVAVMGPYFAYDGEELYSHFSAAAAACAPLPFYLYEYQARAGYAVPLAVIERLRDAAPNFVGMKVSDSPWEAFASICSRGSTCSSAPRRSSRAASPRERRGGLGACRGLPRPDCRPRGQSQRYGLDADRAAARVDPKFPFLAAMKALLARRGVAIRGDVRAPLRGLTRDERARLDRLYDEWQESSSRAAARIGVCIAHSLAERGARGVVLCDRGEIAGAPREGHGGVRQQFSTAIEVEPHPPERGVLRKLGSPYFEQVGYLFVASTEKEWEALRARAEHQRSLGVPVETADRARIAALAPGSPRAISSAASLWERRPRRPPPRRSRWRGARALSASRSSSTPTRARSRPTCGSSRRGPTRPSSGGSGVELPIRPLIRQLFETGPILGIAPRLPMVIESETGFHFRRRGDGLRVAMGDPAPRWSFDARVDESVLGDRLRRLAHRFPAAAGARVDRAWAGLYDMTPDAHPILGKVGDSLFVACGFSGHGFMQAPAVGEAIAQLVLEGERPGPGAFLLRRFKDGASFAETVVL